MNPPHPMSKRSPERRKDHASNDGAFGLALLLAGLAGWVDAAGVTSSDGVFASFMSGNTTDLAVSTVQRDWLEVAVLGAVLGLFVVGVMVGELLEPLAGWFGRPLIFGLEAVMLALGAAVHWRLVTMPALAAFAPCLLAFAMGLQNAAMHRAGGISIGVTYVTGTLVHLGQALADVARFKGGGRKALQYGALWLSLACGAGLGALAMSVSPVGGLSVAAGVAGCLAVATALGRAASRY